MEVEDGGDHIDGYPDEPLLEVFVGQSPDAHHTEGGGEAVGQGHGRVGEGDQQPVDERPQTDHDDAPAQGNVTRHVGNGNRSLPKPLRRRGCLITG